MKFEYSFSTLKNKVPHEHDEFQSKILCCVETGKEANRMLFSIFKFLAKQYLKCIATAKQFLCFRSFFNMLFNFFGNLQHLNDFGFYHSFHIFSQER